MQAFLLLGACCKGLPFLLSPVPAVRTCSPESWRASSFGETVMTKPTRILRLPDLRAKVPLSRSVIYQRIAEGTFPAPISLGPRAVGWVEEDIERWIAE